MNKKHYQCPACPSNSAEKCQRAVESIRMIQLAQLKKENTANLELPCEWYVNIAEYGYTFKNLVKDLDGLPMTDKEICKALMITPAELKETYNSALKKLALPENRHILQELREIVSEQGNDLDNSLYMPHEFSNQLESENAILTPIEDGEDPYTPKKRGPKPKNKQPLHGMGLPLHHSGKRIDIHFGYSSSRSNEIAENKKKIKKKDKPE